MTKLLVLLYICVSSLSTNPITPSIADIDIDDTLAKHFTNFVQFYNKKYQAHEQEHRFAVFKENVKMIQELNAAHDGVTYDINAFADLTPKEFSETVLTPLSDPFDEIFKLPVLGKADIIGKSPILQPDGSLIISNDVPKSVDWTKTPCMAGVKDQSFCGSCWAFSTINPLETDICIQKILAGENPTLIELSEQQLVDCDRETNSGCQGGLYHVAFKYIEQKGICKSEDYRYTGSNMGDCQERACKAVQKVKSIKRVSRSIDDVKSAVARGPLSVAIDASRIQFYKNGIYKTCKSTTENDLNHAVTLVGYGVDHTTNTQYWIVRNSWGPNWGDRGYIRMQINELEGITDMGMCGILWGPVAIEAEPVIKKQHLRESVYVG